MTAVTRSAMGVLRDDPALFEMMMTAIEEAIAVGTARGVTFPPDLIESTLAMIPEFPGGLEVIDARRSRARTPPRVALAERRGGAHREGSWRADANPPVHHRGFDAVRERIEVVADTIRSNPANLMADPFDSLKAGDAGLQRAQGERLRQLMREYQSGRFEAFDEIYASIAPALRRYLLSQARDGAKADDLVQETFLQMHRARHTYDASFPLMPWAMAIARHVWLMDRRTSRAAPGRPTT